MSKKKNTPLQELIRKIEMMQVADAVINPLGICKELAIDLLSVERKEFEDVFRDGISTGQNELNLPPSKWTSASNYFTNNYQS